MGFPMLFWLSLRRVGRGSSGSANRAAATAFSFSGPGPNHKSTWITGQSLVRRNATSSALGQKHILNPCVFAYSTEPVS